MRITFCPCPCHYHTRPSCTLGLGRHAHFTHHPPFFQRGRRNSAPRFHLSSRLSGSLYFCASIMEYHCGSSREDWNVIHLADAFAKPERTGHRCGFNCKVEHVWANLYVCRSTGNSHVCDKNCDQRITYDNHSNICRASGQIFPSHGQPIHGVRRKHDSEAFESHNRKRYRNISTQVTCEEMDIA